MGKRGPTPHGTHRRQVLVSEYMANGGNKYRAGLAAGYSETTSYNSIMFNHPWVKAEIKRREAQMLARSELNEEWVLKRLMALGDAPRVLAKYKKITNDGSLIWDFTGAPDEDLALVHELTVDYYTDGKGEGAREVKKFKVTTPDPMAALNALGRHLKMFTDKVDVNDTSEAVDELNKGRQRVKKLNEDQ